MTTADNREDRITSDEEPAAPTVPMKREPGTGPLTPEEHEAAKAARPRQPAPQSVEDHLFALVQKGIKGDPTHKPSHADPLSRVVSGSEISGRYIPTISLDPKCVEMIDGVNEDNIGYIRPAIDAFGTIFGALQRVDNARTQAAKDPSKTEASQILLVANEAEKLEKRAIQAFDSAHKRLTDGIKALDESLSKPLTAAADTVIGAEIRKHCKDLPDDKRNAFIMNALNNRDMATLNAALGARGYLSGLSDEMQAHFTRQFHEQQNPEIARRVGVMRKALELVGQRGPLIRVEIQRALRARWGVVSKLRETQSAADQALLLINNPVQQS